MAHPSAVVSVRRPITHVVFDMDGLLLGILLIYYSIYHQPHSCCLSKTMLLLQTLRGSILKFKKSYSLGTTKPLIGLSRQRWWERMQYNLLGYLLKSLELVILLGLSNSWWKERICCITCFLLVSLCQVCELMEIGIGCPYLINIGLKNHVCKFKPCSAQREAENDIPDMWLEDL